MTAHTFTNNQKLTSALDRIAKNSHATQAKPASQISEPKNRTVPAQPITQTATPTPATPTAPIIQMTDAPYSWTLTAMDTTGFSELFTVRAVSEPGFFARVTRVKAKLIADSYKPAPTRGGALPHATNDGSADDAPLCAIHKTPMAKRQGKNGSFWSCPQRLDDQSFCPYRPPKH